MITYDAGNIVLDDEDIVYEYDRDIIPYVAQGFTEYIVYEAGR